MKTVLAIDLGKRNSVFCRPDINSLKPEYLTEKTDPLKFHDQLWIMRQVLLHGPGVLMSLTLWQE